MTPPSSARSQTPQADHARWFSDEVHAHEAQLKAYLRSSFPRVRDVDDVVQESYLRIWQARMARPIASARAFLFQVARHLAIDVLRQGRAASFGDLPDFSPSAVLDESRNAADSLSYQEKVSLVAEALTRLPARCREIFILKKFQHVSQREIAMRLRISERTVESQVTRGMKLMEAFLRRRGLDGFICGEE